MHAQSKQAQLLKPPMQSVQEAMITALDIRRQRVQSMTPCTEQVVGDHNSLCDRLSEVSHVVNALREAVIDASERQMINCNDARIAVVTEVKEE